jgi:hypothetical protein
MTDKQLAVLLRGYAGRIRREIGDAVTLLPAEAKELRKVGILNHEYITAPALDGFEELAREIAGDAEMLERERVA